ncbi:hypothetical protein D3C75_1333560 [compost metagenome]
MHNMQDVQQLAFVGMQPFDLYIEDGIRVYLHSMLLTDVFRQALLVAAFDASHLLLE